MKVSLVKINGKSYSIGAGRYCFLLDGGKPIHSEDQRIGSRVAGKEVEYDAAFELACFAAESELYDAVENH